MLKLKSEKLPQVKLRAEKEPNYLERASGSAGQEVCVHCLSTGKTTYKGWRKEGRLGEGRLADAYPEVWSDRRRSSAVPYRIHCMFQKPRRKNMFSPQGSTK